MWSKSIMMLVAIFMVATGFAKSRTVKTPGIKGDILFSQQQIGRELKVIGDSGKILNPVTMSSSGKVYYCNYADWRSGFFPGSLWYLYELTGKEYWAQEAEKFTESIEKAKNITYHHDIGFIINCSFGNGLRLKNIDAYKDVIVTAAKSLYTVPPSGRCSAILECNRQELAG